MKILVTGATGLIGCHTLAELLERGHDVRVLVRDASKLARTLAPFGRALDDVDVVVGTIGDRADVERALEGVSVLLHSAGLFSPERRDVALLEATNVEGTRVVLEAVREVPIERVVYVSSILALAPSAGAKMTAFDPVADPKEMYAATKAKAERIAREAQTDLPLTIVYPSAVQGPFDPTFSVGPQLVAAALADGKVLVTEGGLPTTDVRDLAVVLASVSEGLTQVTRLMAPSFFMPHDHFYALLSELTGRRLEAQRVPGWLLRGMGRMGDIAQALGRPIQLTSEAAAVLTRSVPVDDREASRILGRAPIQDDASFRDLIKWMVTAGHLDSSAAGRLASRDDPNDRFRR